MSFSLPPLMLRCCGQEPGPDGRECPERQHCLRALDPEPGCYPRLPELLCQTPALRFYHPLRRTP